MTGSKELFTKLTSWAGEYPDSLAVIETETDKRLSYRDMIHATAGVRELLGIVPRTIMITLPGGIPDAVLWLTALMYGHRLIPLSPALTDDEFTDALRIHTPDIVIVPAMDTFPPNDSRTVTLVELQKVIAESIGGAPPLSDAVSDGSVILSTSGSTGEPKRMELSTTLIVITASNIAESHQITRLDRGLTPLPFYHVNAPIVSLLTSVLTGSCVIIAPKFSASHFWEWVEKYDPTWISVVPTIIAILLKSDRSAFLDHASLRFMRTASAPMPLANILAFEKKFRIPLIETYGISEAGSTITANPVPPGIHKPGSVGLPILPMRICSFDESGNMQDVPVGTPGEICISGPNVIQAYEANAGADSFHDGWFRTGDLGYMDEDGYVYVTGRKKEIIIRGGENIAPREIEEVLMTYPGVQEAAVVGQSDPIYGERVTAFVVFDREKGPGETAKLHSFVAEKLSPQKVPSEIHVLDDLPRGRTGKIDKKSLKTYHPSR